MNDPADGLIVSNAREWAREKHRLLGEYIDSAWAARRKWSQWGTCSYTDLFCGPGRQAMEGGSEIINGSPLVAWVSSNLNPAPFGQVFISDKRSFAEACERRLKKLRAPVTIAALNAEEAAAVVAKKVHRKGLHLVFADPYNLGDLTWRIFEPLVNLERIDFIVHFHQADLTRNLDLYFDQDPSPLDDVAPGWRAHVTLGEKVQMRGKFFEYWVSLFERHHFKRARAIPLFETGTRVPLYRLVLLSRNDLASKLWNSVSKEDLQGRLFG